MARVRCMAPGGGPPQGVGRRLLGVCREVVRRPWLLAAWIGLAAVGVESAYWIPQPWYALVHPVVLIVAMQLYYRATSRR